MIYFETDAGLYTDGAAAQPFFPADTLLRQPISPKFTSATAARHHQKKEAPLPAQRRFFDIIKITAIITKNGWLADDFILPDAVI